MKETIAQYTERIKGYVEGKDPLEVQRRAYQTVTGLLKDLSAEELNRERSPGHWSAREIVAHLADVEVVSTWRYRQIIEKSGLDLAAYDQDEWARLGDYRSAPLEESLDVLRLLRSNNLKMFGRLTPEEWERFGVHAERGKMTVADLVLQVAGHDLNHIEQLREIASNSKLSR